MYSPLKFMEAIKVCFNKYADFTGRASRSEYWWFTLFCYLISLIADFIDVYLLYGAIDELGFFGLITAFICMIPSISVAIRRLHDVNRSGWSWLWAFTIIGVIPVLYWSVKAGDDGKNYYGVNPLKKRKNNNVVGAEASISKFADKEKIDAIENEDLSEDFEDTEMSEIKEASTDESMYLEFQNGSLNGQRIMIFKSTTIGRSSENDIVLNNNKISGAHCKLSIQKNEFFIEDLKSTNGTFVNGNKISKSKIKRGDELKLSSIKIKVE